MTATTHTADLGINEQTKRIRHDLRAEFPGVKFSVSRGRGTAALWVDVDWTDGPTEPQVREIVARHRREYCGQTIINRRYSSAVEEQMRAEVARWVDPADYYETQRELRHRLASKTLPAVVA